jgi:hypothetical protein
MDNLIFEISQIEITDTSKKKEGIEKLKFLKLFKMD